MSIPGAFTVAIDGPAASGKGTVSRQIADHFGFAHLDTGLLYRAVALRVLSGDDPLQAAEGLREADLQRDGLRGSEVAQAASRVAAVAEVRAALLDFQRRFARREGGAILDGRDIGSVVCPDAEVKLFVTASDQVRAARRFAEMQARGEDVTLDGVLQALKERDARDSQRATAPLVAAPDAVLLDTTDMTIDEAVARAIAIVEDRLARIDS
ncbi:MAG: (d)CMP kinase [Rhodobacteraceae bacterium]|nr:(d)CMP kinase [Paracoccaceae bacterium]